MFAALPRQFKWYVLTIGQILRDSKNKLVFTTTHPDGWCDTCTYLHQAKTVVRCTCHTNAYFCEKCPKAYPSIWATFFQLDSRCCPFPWTTEMLKRTPNLLSHNSYPSCDLPVAVWSLQKKKKRTSFNSAVNKKSFRTNTTILAADLAVGKMWTEENEENEHKRWGEMGLCAPFSILWPHELHRTNRKVCTRKEYQTNRFRLKPKGSLLWVSVFCLSGIFWFLDCFAFFPFRQDVRPLLFVRLARVRKIWLFGKISYAVKNIRPAFSVSQSQWGVLLG